MLTFSSNARAKALAAIAVCAVLLAGDLGQAPSLAAGPTPTLVPEFGLVLPDQRLSALEPSKATRARDREACETSAASVPTFCVTLPGTAEHAMARPDIDRLSSATGTRFLQIETARGHLIADAALPPETLGELAAVIDRDVAVLEGRFGESFASKPYVYVASTRSSFRAVLSRGFGQSGRGLAQLAASGGVYVPAPEAVIVNWQNVAQTRPISIVRHELAHVLMRQLTPTATLPVWLEEGLAALEESMLTEDVRDRYVARALVTHGRISLADLGVASGWLAAGSDHGGQSYDVAAEAARMMRSELGGDRLTLALREAERLGSFASAYEKVAAEPLAAFVRRFPSKIARDLPAYRVDVARTAAPGAIWTLLGFLPGETVSIVIEGQLYRAVFDVTVDENGIYSAAFGSTAPRGTYWLIAHATGGSARGVIVN